MYLINTTWSLCTDYLKCLNSVTCTCVGVYDVHVWRPVQPEQKPSNYNFFLNL